MKGFVTNIERETEENTLFRKVLYTAKHSQLVLMSLRPGEDIGEEVHTLDQFIRIEQGEGVVTLDGVKHDIRDGFAFVIPAGMKHNVLNTSSTEPMKLYTVYAPPEHRDGVIRATKEDAMKNEEHFDGATSE